jgi:peroxiredoxin
MTLLESPQVFPPVRSQEKSRRWTSVPATFVVCALGLLSQGAAGSAAQLGATHEVAIPEALPVSDADLSRLTAELDKKLALERDPAKWAGAARLPLWDFARQLQAGRLTPAQQTRAVAHLTQIGRAHAGGAEAVQKPAYMITALSIGKVAPDVAGTDLDGAPLRLRDFRGKVVVLLFSGDWCGICRSDYPYTRQLLERFKHADVTVLGVDSGRSLDESRQAKTAQGLAYRAWWDGGSARNTEGPIATAWHVVGWPTTYVIDARGVIRFVDVRREALAEAVSQLLPSTTPAPGR